MVRVFSRQSTRQRIVTGTNFLHQTYRSLISFKVLSRIAVQRDPQASAASPLPPTATANDPVPRGWSLARRTAEGLPRGQSRAMVPWTRLIRLFSPHGAVGIASHLFLITGAARSPVSKSVCQGAGELVSSRPQPGSIWLGFEPIVEGASVRSGTDNREGIRLGPQEFSGLNSTKAANRWTTDAPAAPTPPGVPMSGGLLPVCDRPAVDGQVGDVAERQGDMTKEA